MGTSIQTVSLSLFRFGTLADRLWAFAMMGLARRSLSRLDGLLFWKLCGSGTGEGFTPVPNTSIYAILCTWPDHSTAEQQLETGKVFQRYRRRASESWTVFLKPATSRGHWAGQTPFDPDGAELNGPLAALTRATIKPRILRDFWRRTPEISDVIGADKNVVFKIGIGEVPLLHQVTFSIWPDTHSMAAFARKSGAHARAIKAVREGDWFREELYARFRIVGDRGSWDGGSPLSGLDLRL